MTFHSTSYAYCMTVPATGTQLRITSLGTTANALGKPVKSVKLLGYTGTLTWKQEPDSLVVTLPDTSAFRTALGFKIAPPEAKTYGAQSTYLLRVTGSKKTSVIYMGDIWRPKNHADGRYFWMPLEIGGGQLRLPPPNPWTIDVKTGEVRIQPAQN